MSRIGHPGAAASKRGTGPNKTPKTPKRSRYPAPTPWSSREGPLLPPDRVRDIDTAIAQLVPPGERGHNRFLRAVRCVVPDVAVVSTLVGDAFGTLAGDGAAADRLISALELLGERPRFDGEGAGRASEEPELNLEALERWNQALAEAGNEHRDPGREAIPDDRLVPTLLAASYVGSLRPGRGDHYVGLLHESLGHLETLDALWRGARGALAGDERSASFLGVLLERISDDFELDDAPLAPWGEPQPRPRAGLPPVGLPKWPPPPQLDPRKFIDRIPGQELRRLTCLVTSRLAFKKPTLPGVPVGTAPTYKVSSISPTGGCVGTLITIVGNGFGSTPGSVVFPGGGTVTAETWSDTQITVRVPAGAICGDVRPLIYERTEFVCGEGFDIYRTGSVAMQFDGSAPAILAFAVSGPVRMWKGTVRVEPGATLTAAWSACGMQGTVARFRVYAGTSVLRDTPSAPLTGTDAIAMPNFTATTVVTFELTATNACAAAPVVARNLVTVTKVADLTVEGIEVTQGLQYYNSAEHLTDAGDVNPTNSLTLVADKETWVRVYVRSGQNPAFDGGAVDKVAALLSVTHISGTGSTGLGGPASENPWVTAQATPTYRTTRLNSDRTINFRIPSWWCRDTLQFTAILNWANFVEERDSTNNTATVTADFTTRRVLRLRGIWVDYDFTDANGVRTQLPAPGMPDLLGGSRWLERTFPLSDITYTSVGTTTLTQPLTDPPTAPGGCSPNWGTLLGAIASVATADCNRPDSVYVGLIPGGVPIGPVTGCGGGVAAAPAGQPVTLAHEVGHILGLQHAPCGVNGDPAYPLYEPYDAAPLPGTVPGNASIGEFGVDIDDGSIHDPQTEKDFMSYCGPQWISLYHYTQLLSAARLSPTIVLCAAGPVLGPAAAGGHVGGGHGGSGSDDAHGNHAHVEDELTPREGVYISGLIGPGDTVVLNPMHRAHGFPVRPEPVRTRFRVALADEAGRVLADTAIMLDARYAGPAPDLELACPCFFFASVRYVDGARQVVVSRDGEVVHRVTVPVHAPGLRLSKPGTTRQGGRRLRLTWEATHADGLPLTYWVRYSADGGESWQPLAVNLTKESFDVDLTQIPGGRGRLLQVGAHDGFNSVYRAVGPFDIPLWPPDAIIIHPADGQVVHGQQTLLLRGEGLSIQDGSLPREAMRWTSDREGELGYGKRVPVRLSAHGPHRLTLTVTDHGGVSRRTSVSVVVAAEETPAE